MLADNEQRESASAAESSRWRIVHYVFLLTLCLLTGWLVYWITRPFLKPIITAILLAVVYYPIHLRWARAIRYPNLAALVSTLTVLVTLIVPFAILGVAVERELADLYRLLSEQSAQDGGWGPWLSHTSERFSNWIRRYVDVPPFDLKTVVLEQLRRAGATAVTDLANLVGNIAAFIVDGVISFFTLFFVFRDGREIYDRVEGVVPLRPGQVERLREEIGRTITASVYGGLAVAASQGTLTGLAFVALGIPSPVVWGMAAALFSLVPLLGPALVWGPAAIILFLGGHWVKGMILLAWGAMVVGLADNIIRPYVISEQVRFYPLAIFIALLGGAQAFGLLGLFIGPIVLAVAQALLALIREENQLRQLGY